VGLNPRTPRARAKPVLVAYPFLALLLTDVHDLPSIGLQFLMKKPGSEKGVHEPVFVFVMEYDSELQ
jgi:hypothetical protein